MNTPGTFDDSAKELVRSRIDLASLVGRYVALKQSGQTLKGLCPFHKEKTPSFHVNPTRGFYHCFGCGKSGDAFSFVQEIEKLSFPEALHKLADETGVTLPEHASDQPAQTSSDDQPRIPKAEMQRIHSVAGAFYYAQIRRFPAAVEYFKSRGLAAATVKEFKLGYAPPGWTGLLSHCSAQGIPELSMAACGLAIKKEGGGVYDRFRDRIMFPLCDMGSKVIGFAGRGMEPDAKPKYLNSPETPLYQKNKYLYGLDRARTAVHETGRLMIVEGYMDYLTLWQSGIRNVAATSGTALTPEHAQIITRFTKNLVLVFDGDDAGQTAARRALFVLAPFDLDVSILVLPGDEDPDSFVKKNGAEAFNEQLAHVRKGNNYIVDKLLAEKGTTARGKMGVIDELVPMIRSITNPIAQEELIKELIGRLMVDPKIVHEKIGNLRQRTPVPRVMISSADRYLTSLEGSFIHLLLTKPELTATATQYIAPETLTDGVSGNIYSLITETWRDRGSLEGILDRVSDPEIKRLISMMLVKPALEQHAHEELVQKIVHLQIKFIRARMREINATIRREPGHRDELLRELKDYATQLKELDERG
jgi:DNA primase